MAGSKGPERNEYLQLQPLTILRYGYHGRTREMLQAIKEELYFEEDDEADDWMSDNKSKDIDFASIRWYFEKELTDEEWQIFPDEWLKEIGLKTPDEPTTETTETTTTTTVTTTTSSSGTSPIVRVTPITTPITTPVSTPKRQTPVKQTARKSTGGKAQAGQLHRQDPQDPDDTEIEPDPTDTEPEPEYPYHSRAAKRPSEVEGYYEVPEEKKYKFSKTKADTRSKPT